MGSGSLTLLHAMQLSQCNNMRLQSAFAHLEYAFLQEKEMDIEVMEGIEGYQAFMKAANTLLDPLMFEDIAFICRDPVTGIYLVQPVQNAAIHFVRLSDLAVRC